MLGSLSRHTQTPPPPIEFRYPFLHDAAYPRSKIIRRDAHYLLYGSQSSTHFSDHQLRMHERHIYGGSSDGGCDGRPMVRVHQLALVRDSWLPEGLPPAIRSIRGFRR